MASLSYWCETDESVESLQVLERARVAATQRRGWTMERWRTEERPSITGLGVVSAYGWGRKHLWDGLLSGETAAAPVPGYASHLEYDSAWVARVADEGDPEDGPSRFSRAISAATRE